MVQLRDKPSLPHYLPGAGFNHSGPVDSPLWLATLQARRIRPQQVVEMHPYKALCRHGGMCSHTGRNLCPANVVHAECCAHIPGGNSDGNGRNEQQIQKQQRRGEEPVNVPADIFACIDSSVI